MEGGLVERALGTGYYLLPAELCTVDEDLEIIRASVDGDTVLNFPYLDSALNLSSDHASGIREYTTGSRAKASDRRNSVLLEPVPERRLHREHRLPALRDRCPSQPCSPRDLA